ncbi:MAG: hypothetical protein R2854_05020 [Caldilineaceae bacterium]
MRREQTSDGKEAISAYVVRGDGSIVQSEELLLAQDNYTPTDPAVACNAGGACLTLWGGIFPNDVYMITGYRLAHNLSNPTSFYQEVDGVLSNVAVASDGADFMLAWIQAGDVMLVKVPATGSIGTPKQVATISGAGVATAIGWTGTNYTILWTGDGSIHQADVSTDGDVSNAGVLSAGSGWPQSDGSTHPPLLACEAISAAARRWSPTARRPENCARSVVNCCRRRVHPRGCGVADNDGVTVALSPDARVPSGWAVAWTPRPPVQSNIAAISPQGALRGEIGLIDQSTVTALALTCLPPRPLLLLAFDEKAGETVFHDSSGNNRTATCSDDCPEAGVSGRFGNAAAFNGSSQAPTVDGIALTSFTVATWLRRGDTGRGQTIAATGGPTLRFGFNENDTLFCDFGDATFDTVTVTTSVSAWTSVAPLCLHI